MTTGPPWRIFLGEGKNPRGYAQKQATGSLNSSLA